MLPNMENVHFNENKYDSLIKRIVQQIILECKLNLNIPNSFNLNFTIDDDKLKNTLIQYLYETSNN